MRSLPPSRSPLLEQRDRGVGGPSSVRRPESRRPARRRPRPTHRRPRVGDSPASQRASSVDEVDDAGQHVRVGLRQHAVAEVEDVARGRPPSSRMRRTSASITAERANSTAGSRLPWTGVGRCGGPPVERRAPVDADDVGAGLAHRRQQLAGADAEVDPRHAGVGDAPRARARSAAARSAGSPPRTARRPRSRTAGPRSTPAVDLHPQERRGDVGEPGAQGVPHAPAPPYISALVRSWSADGPPSTR